MEWDLVQGAGFSLLARLPVLAVWITVLVLGIIMARRGGGKAAVFIAAGGGIKLAGIILSAVFPFTTIWLFLGSGNTETHTTVSEAATWLVNIVSMAGYLCLFYAFWVKSTTSGESTPGIPYSPQRPYPSDSGLPNQPR